MLIAYGLSLQVTLCVKKVGYVKPMDSSVDILYSRVRLRVGTLQADQMFVELYARHLRILFIETGADRMCQVPLKRFQSLQSALCKFVLVQWVFCALTCLIGNLDGEGLLQQLEHFPSSQPLECEYWMK